MKIAFFEIFNEIIRGEKEILENFFLKEEILYFNEKLSLENVIQSKMPKSYPFLPVRWSIRKLLIYCQT